MSTPLCRVSFHSEEKLYTFDRTVSSEKDPTSVLMSVSTNKSLKSPAGSFNITLAGDAFYRKIKPQDLVVIEMGRPPETMNTVMICLVDEVRRTRSMGTKNQVEIRTAINGRDFGKVLLTAVVKWLPMFGTDEFPVESLSGAEAQLFQMLRFYTEVGHQQGSPAMIIDQAIRGVLHSIMNFTVKYWKDGQLVDATLEDIFRFRLGRTNAIFDLWTSMGDFEGPLWNFMSSVENKPFFELFLDTSIVNIKKFPGHMLKQSQVEKDSYGVGNFSAGFGADNAKVVLYLRPTPFDDADWNDLSTVFIGDEDITGEELGYSDHENYNMFMVIPKMTIVGEDVYRAHVRPVVSGENMKKYGISFMEVPLEGLFSRDGQVDEFMLETGLAMTNKLKDWFEKNIEYENGTYQLRGMEGAKVGMRLVNTSEGTEFYIEGVSQNFGSFNRWTTTIQATRGRGVEQTIETPQNTIIPPKHPTTATTSDMLVGEPVRYHIVVRGETLWGIAVKYYGRGQDYTKIYKANRHIISNPGLIYPGQKFVIP